MILTILKVIHVAFGLVAIGATVTVLFGVLVGRLTVRRTVVFLDCFLATSATGLLFPFHYFLFTHWAAMLGVYVSGIAVLALCKHHLAGSWRSIFAVTIVILLCLNVLVSIAHILKFMPIFGALAPV